MSAFNRQAHWQNVYKEKGENQVSWFQERPTISLELIEAAGAKPASAIIDVGGGASRLVDALIEKGYRDLTVLDLSESAVTIAKMRLGQSAAMVKWIVEDVTQWQPAGHYDLWHDRAAFHFLTEPSDKTAYIERLTKALRPGGHAIIGTFAPDGPERCSGLPVVRYDPRSSLPYWNRRLHWSICAATNIKRRGAPFSSSSLACSGACKPMRCQSRTMPVPHRDRQ